MSKFLFMANSPQLGGSPIHGGSNSLEFEGISNEAGRYGERLKRLNQIAIREMQSLVTSPAMKKLPKFCGEQQ